MSDFTTAEENSLLNATTITHVAAFNGEPGNGGTEVGTNRGAITWSAAASGQKAASNTPQVSCPAGANVTWVGYYDAASAGSLRGKDQLASAEVFGAAGVLNVTGIVLDLT